MRNAVLTKTLVDRLPLTTSGQVLVRDIKLTGFGVRIGRTCKAYFAEARVRGRPRRVTIGLHGLLTAEEARSRARVLLGHMTRGVDPVEARRIERAKSVTLAEAVDDYLAVHILRPNTRRDYDACMRRYFADWRTRLLTTVTPDAVEARHRKITESSPAQANLAMRFLRAVFNRAMDRYTGIDGAPIIVANPVGRLTRQRLWNRIERRRGVIRTHALEPWYYAVMGLKNTPQHLTLETARDYMLLILFTGLRREEAATLAWRDVDLKAKILIIRETKNGDVHELPLADFVANLLLARRDKTGESPYVFPGPKNGHIGETRKQWERVFKESGVKFTLHDLRRTFITIAESIDVSPYAIKRLVNHRMSDVTAGYIVSDVERLREPMRRIETFLLRAIGLAAAARILPFRGDQPAAQRPLIGG